MHMLMLLLGLMTGSPETAIPVHLGTGENVGEARAIRERAGEDWMFYLGANGELVTPSKLEDSTLGMVYPIYCTKESDKRAVWLPYFNHPFAEIRQNGDIVVLDSYYIADIIVPKNREKIVRNVHVSPDLFPDFPTRWPYIRDGVLLPAPPGAILSKSLERKKPPPEGSSGARGWLILGWKGELISPVQGSSAPENVVWMVSSDLHGGMDLIHSGPRFSGRYAHVSPYGKMGFGDGLTDSPPLLPLERTLMIIDDEHIVPTKSFWPFFSEVGRKQLAPIPPGYSVQPTDTHPDFVTAVVNEDGSVQVIRRKIRVY